ncbi:hypothetical protein [Polyangium jinanense]|uniref:Uncharacterized protein n=1 Tax=Polyangium jinanense TaxID=2829994 RepID=A0A9X3X3G6_9BACT|nr:hypothetical protein [Polyangium jinanense]MDC3956032.1 hypothetical protein [Polyangium jinanense]MDC3982937.1 hypothetical protein [Polyangium jinanense]
MKRNIGRILASMLFLGATIGVLFGGSAPAEAQQSDQPCINVCRQRERDCLDDANNPGQRKQCRRDFEDCVEDLCRS